MWLMSTRGRPTHCAEALQACAAAQMTSPGIVIVDGDPFGYTGLRLPPNWEMLCPREEWNLSRHMQYVFERWPNEDRYAWLADDVRPRTPEFDKALEKAAGPFGFADANDLWMALNMVEGRPHTRTAAISGHMTSGLVWGGDLVRCVGWWGVPGLVQAGIDTVWEAIIRPLNLFTYCDDVICEHLNWRTGKRVKDGTDEWIRDGDPYIERDIRAARAFVASDEIKEIRHRVATHKPRAA